MRFFLQRIIFLFFAILIVYPFISDGQVRESTSYKIESDSINIGGGYGSSTNYQSESTVGEIATGRSTSTSYKIDAGYQQTVEATYITVSAPANITLDPINGLTGGSATSSATWKVTTNNNSGYSMTIKASTNPALKSSNDDFEDYTPAGLVPDFDFSIASTDAEFGFSPSGSDILSKFKDNGSACGVSTSDTLYKCWDGLSTSEATISQSASSNDPSGTDTVVHFQAESGNQKILTAGTYQATITVTAVAL